MSMDKHINIFEAVLKGASFWYKKSLFILVGITYSVREFVSHNIFEDEDTIALVTRNWVYVNGALRMKKEKESFIFSKKTNSLYHRKVYKDETNTWKTLFYGLSFATVKGELFAHTMERKLMVARFTQKIADAVGMEVYVNEEEEDGRLLESILLALRVGFPVNPREERMAMKEHRKNNVPLRTVYRRLRNGVYYDACEKAQQKAQEEEGHYW